MRNEWIGSATSSAMCIAIATLIVVEIFFTEDLPHSMRIYAWAAVAILLILAFFFIAEGRRISRKRKKSGDEADDLSDENA
jgi:hypothetical protein